MADVANYHVLVYGASDGYHDSRSQIASYDDRHNVLDVLDVRRNGKPINFYFASGHVFLGTGSLEPVGEAEA
jgi:hypothetical protein